MAGVRGWRGGWRCQRQALCGAPGAFVRAAPTLSTPRMSALPPAKRCTWDQGDQEGVVCACVAPPQAWIPPPGWVLARSRGPPRAIAPSAGFYGLGAACAPARGAALLAGCRRRQQQQGTTSPGGGSGRQARPFPAHGCSPTNPAVPNLPLPVISSCKRWAIHHAAAWHERRAARQQAGPCTVRLGPRMAALHGGSTNAAGLAAGAVPPNTPLSIGLNAGLVEM